MLNAKADEREAVMTLKEKAKILDKDSMAKAIKRIAHEVIERAVPLEDVAIIGIKNRGAYLGERLADMIKDTAGTRPPFGALDITLYRDDLTKASEQPIVHATEIDFDIEGKRVILVDDVLYTGRTIRCALDALIDFGRPKEIQLAVLIDRGHRELPIRADYVGKNVPTALNEIVEVRIVEADGKDEVVICEKGDG